jgi:hypothetical protein
MQHAEFVLRPWVDAEVRRPRPNGCTYDDSHGEEYAMQHTRCERHESGKHVQPMLKGSELRGSAHFECGERGDRDDVLLPGKPSHVVPVSTGQRRRSHLLFVKC